MLLSRQLLESNTGLNRFLHRGGRPTAVHPTERSAEPDGDADDGDNYLGRRAKGYRREIATDSSDEEDGSSTHGRTHGRHHAGSHSGHSSGRQSRSDGHYRERIAFQRAATAAKFVRARNQLKLELSQIEQFALPARYVLPSTPAMDAGTSPDTTLVSRDSAVMTPQKRKEPSESRPLWKRATTLSGIAYGNSNQLSDRFEAAVPRIDVAPEAVGLIPRKQQPPRTLRTSGQETGGEETRGQELKGPAAGVGSMPSPATSAAETGVAETSVDHAPVSVCSYFTPAAAWKDVLGVEVFVPTSADKAALWPTYFHDLLQRCPNHPLKATVTKLSRSHLPPSTRENTTSTLLTSSGDMTPSVMGQGVMRREELLHALFG
ncbi:hypothetical protein GNI_065900 [Gregarina niphandrodes]|uniref:Uncharacterized protein n=1 Tax=Gregarina niphandrodes TaxID=110365 RepID=A0A023B7T1_GRENI|nr:hypothetical protein GNI_065900 [Gregarina niphandrodes]EZG67840.1 hypothetical protein GNI_065900 [Gregarina niphandrodes]|eukprot:XP_011130146.1 hypothetical protein GNI_065900 [Gregarina niphandrodes]